MTLDVNEADSEFVAAALQSLCSRAHVGNEHDELVPENVKADWLLRGNVLLKGWEPFASHWQTGTLIAMTQGSAIKAWYRDHGWNVDLARGRISPTTRVCEGCPAYLGCVLSGRVVVTD